MIASVALATGMAAIAQTSGNPTNSGYDRTRIQLPQIVMLPKHTEYRIPPDPGPHHIGSISSSNPSVANAYLNTSGDEQVLRIYSERLDQTFINFTDNGRNYQIHVWVVSDPKFIPPALPGRGATATYGTPKGGPKPVPGPKPGPGPKGNPIAAPIAPGKMDACLVGTWRSQSITVSQPGFGGITGGAGILLTIKGNGAVDVDYDGMRPITEPMPMGKSNSNRLSGSASGIITASAGTARVVKVLSSSVIHTNVDAQGRNKSNPVSSLGDGVPGTNPPGYRYACGASSLSWDSFIHAFRFERVKR
jgi:hypothetical protein